MFEAIENAVKRLRDATESISNQVDIAQIEAAVIVIDLATNDETVVEDLSEEEVMSLRKLISEANLPRLSETDLRQVLQLWLVGVMREDGLQANYQLTPDAIGLWVAFILNRFLPVKAEARVLDLGSGTGNLLATVQQALLSASIQVKGYGVENDDTLITLASGVHALLNQTTELTFGDAVVAPLPDQMDVVIGDLPVGFYPREVPDGFTTVAPDGLSFVHHLLIERGMETVKPGGLGVFLVPAALFESEQATQILSYLQGKAVFFQAFMQFPEKLFANTGSAKAMLILQRAGGDAKQAEPVLLAQVPELAKRLENQNVVAELVAWMTANGLVH